jgi:hypothetical protein
MLSLPTSKVAPSKVQTCPTHSKIFESNLDARPSRGAKYARNPHTIVLEHQKQSAPRFLVRSKLFTVIAITASLLLISKVRALIEFVRAIGGY